MGYCEIYQAPNRAVYYLCLLFKPNTGKQCFTSEFIDTDGVDIFQFMKGSLVAITIKWVICVNIAASFSPYILILIQATYIQIHTTEHSLTQD